MAEFAEILRNAVMGDTTGLDGLAQVCIETLYQVYEYVDKVLAHDLRPLIGILQEISWLQSWTIDGELRKEVKLKDQINASLAKELQWSEATKLRNDCNSKEQEKQGLIKQADDLRQGEQETQNDVKDLLGSIENVIAEHDMVHDQIDSHRTRASKHPLFMSH